ncbi:MAG: hypothetical protein JO348_07115 [Alphaproteobacteria bacterium]|nr:hypothetical protein [Alphaproteobacteria bacterium]MBV9419525.1 hypothetical protein [Alphaproteobacteria bacterium]MBV9541046.1 hypothetical protein [Alphaproteobacteria bacterium]MBV9904103.1 hypothetical protein [Alphaproteobacteria bacterium]
MKHVVTLLIIAVLIGPALADPSARLDVQLGATVAKVCRLGQVKVSSSQNATFDANAEGGAIALNTLADRNTARALPATISVTFDSVCNQTLYIRLVSAKGGLTPDEGTSASGGFANRVDYTASLDWGTGQTNLSTSGGSDANSGVLLSGAQSGPVTLNITIPPGAQPLVAGAYSDVLTVEFANSP